MKKKNETVRVKAKKMIRTVRYPDKKLYGHWGRLIAEKGDEGWATEKEAENIISSTNEYAKSIVRFDRNPRNRKTAWSRDLKIIK